MEPLITPDWLAEHLDDPDLVVLDCTVIVNMETGENRPGRPEYEEAHVPGAVFADLQGDLCDTDAPIGYAVGTPEAFAERIGRLGVGDGTRVVVYDNSWNMWAARVWWMLRWVGFDDAGLLDGGVRAWVEAGHPTSSEVPTVTPRTLTPRPRPELIVDADEVLAAIDAPDVRIIDTLPAQSYTGEQAWYPRPGHILGAVNESVFDLLDHGRFKPVDELRETLGGDPAQRAITYCGGGIAASGSAFAMHLAGYEDVAVYTASLQEWAADPDKPMATGS